MEINIEEIFRKELGSFEFPKSGHREFTLAVMKKLPDYFTEPNADGSDNGIIAHTKASVAFANTLLSLEEYQNKFGTSERDAIRSALLLHDGMFYGTAEEKKACPEHPELMATFIESEAWEDVLPSFLRSDIASAIRKHSGRNTAKGIGVVNGSEVDRFVHMCVYLATRKETTTQLPGMEEYYRRNYAKPSSLDIDVATSIVRQITGGCRWDGQVYTDNESRYVILDNSKVYVADELRDAFLIVGQARVASLQNPNYLQAGSQTMWNPVSQAEPQVLQMNEFIARYPDWNYYVYGTPGNLFIQSGGQNIPITYAQAVALGVTIS